MHNKLLFLAPPLMKWGICAGCLLQLQFLDVMYVDSNGATEGLLDTRLISDLAACPKLEVRSNPDCLLHMAMHNSLICQ